MCASVVQMILDKKFLGILDQETGVLVVFSKELRDTTYDDVNETVTAMNKVRFDFKKTKQDFVWQFF